MFLSYTYPLNALDLDFSGEVSTELRYFPQLPAWQKQKDELDFSEAIKLRLSGEWPEQGNSFILTPYFRWDSLDDERTHFDIRELVFRHHSDNWRFSVGVDKVFWGVTEVYHLVDIINQYDLVDDPDGEQKLGQPMVNLTLQLDWGDIELFYLPYFRERTLPGKAGRFRFPNPISTSTVEYESGAEQWHPDFAVRYFNTIGMLDIGLSHFYGTNRKPLFLQRTNKLIPFYKIINQSSLDAQLTLDEWMFKVEALYQSGGQQDYFASTTGIEYTLFGLLGNADLGILVEYMYDDQGDLATNPFENDLFLGSRLVLNDENSSEILLGIIRDIDDDGQIYLLEASRRLFDNWKFEIEARFFSGTDKADPLRSIKNDDYLVISLTRYF